jgi:hypothetical protein
MWIADVKASLEMSSASSGRPLLLLDAGNNQNFGIDLHIWTV